jgi:hypothetical protein
MLAMTSSNLTAKQKSWGLSLHRTPRKHVNQYPHELRVFRNVLTNETESRAISAQPLWRKTTDSANGIQFPESANDFSLHGVYTGSSTHSVSY